MEKKTAISSSCNEGFCKDVTTRSGRQEMRRMSACCFLILVAVLVVNAAKSASAEEFGSLRLCPAGGRSFMMAWNLACEMKRKKRSVPDVKAPGTAPPISAPTQPPMSRRWAGNAVVQEKRAAPAGYRTATLSEIMRICCDVGCEVRDLLAYCDPFGPWNS